MGYEIISPDLFSFEFSNIENKLINLCSDKDIYAVVGISMGGFILPKIAANFPQAKLIFLATGTKFAPNSRFVKFLVQIISKVYISSFLQNLATRTPRILLKILYVFSVGQGRKKNWDLNFEKMCENFEAMSQVSWGKHADAAKFLLAADTKDLLPVIKNQSLIIFGENDVLMPKSEGVLLNKYLSSSTLVLTQGTRYDVLDKKALDAVSEFLGEIG